MRQLIFAIVMLFAVAVFVIPVHASTMIGPMVPAETGEVDVAFDVEYDKVFDRNFDDDGAFLSGEINDSNAALGVVTFAWSEYFNIYGKLGIQNLELEFDEEGLLGDKIKYELDYDYGPAWAIGMKGAMLVNERSNLLADIQYNGFKAEMEKLEIDGLTAPEFTADDVIVHEVSLSTLLSMDFYPTDSLTFTPYVGARFNYYYLDFGTVTHTTFISTNTMFTGFSGDITGKDKFGFITGLKLSASEHFSTAIEGRFGDETAMSLNGSYKF